MRSLVSGLVLVALLGAAGAAAQDYAARLPRIAPREPAEAIKTLALPPGFHAELVAAEPLIRSPVAIDFDEDGRLFVAEFPEYNQVDNPHFKEHGCIKRLEDTDGDGRFDRATVYAGDLDSPVALACYDGGVFVGAVPNIAYFKDRAGDGKADRKEIVYTGFAKDRAGEAMLNSFRWGLDNRFHVATSNAGGVVRRAGDPAAPAVDVRSRAFRFDPATRHFEITSGAGQHGMSMDDWGRTFVCDNSNPIHLVMYDGRYVARNPFVQPPPVAVNIAEEARTTALRRRSPMEPWRVLRTRLRVAGAVPGPTETGKPGGHFTGATGVTVYRGDAYPRAYHGNVFVGEVANNLVYRATLHPDGVGLVAKRGDPDREFVASTDTWFRPVQFANGPDGCLYVVDMYRELIETVVSIPPVILKHLDPASGIHRGRIYRIVPDGFQRPAAPKLSRATTAELVALLEHPNGWHRDTAARLLYQRQDRAAVAPLTRLAAQSRSPVGRLHALYALDGLRALTPALVAAALRDPEPRLVEHGLRLMERLPAPLPVDRLADHSDLRVRYQLAFTLGLYPGASTTKTLIYLAEHDGQNPWMRLAILTSAGPHAGDLFARLLGRPALRSSAHGKALLGGLAAQVGAANRADGLAAFVQAIDTLPPTDAALGQELMKQLLTKLPPAARGKFQQAGQAGAIFRALLAQARQVVADEKRTPADRATAARTLSLADFKDVQPVLAELLTFRQPALVQRAALEALGRFDEPAVPALVLDAWPGLSPPVRAAAAETLFARPAWIAAFLDAVERGKVRPADVDPARVALLRAGADPALRTRLDRLFAAARLSKRQDVVAAYRKALDLPGDVARGRDVFRKNCTACHRLEGVGEPVGAELAAIRERGNETILLNILDPNREVLPKFLTYRLVTDEGRTITGMITAETATSLTLRRADGTSEAVLRVRIEELRSTGMSFMPEGLEQQIDLQGMADLLAYLQSIR